MGILIEVNTANLEDREAKALRAFLDSMYPDVVVAGPEAPKNPAPLFIPAKADDTAGTTGPALADKLLVAEAARVAALPAAAAATVAPGGQELDKEGIPWDARIHAGSKSKLKDQTWTLKRNVDPGLVTTVKAELKAALAAGGAPAAVPVGTAPAFVPATGAAAPAPLAIQVEGQAPAPRATIGGAPSGTVDYSTATFADVMSRVVDLTVAGVGQEQVNGAMVLIGLAQPRDLAIRPDLVPSAMAVLASLG